MREIKFRGKRIDNGEWVCGSMLTFTNKMASITPSYTKVFKASNEVMTIKNIYDVDPATVGQYTGLHDKNGKEIYEGDIVICPVHEESADYLQLEAGDKNNVTRTICIPDCYQEGLPEDCKVIGNIHDNPELLGVTE